MALHPIDIAVLTIYLAVAVAIGIRVGRGAQGLDGYLLGNRSIPWWAALGSIVATETSTATFLSVPGIAYAPGGDFRFLQLALGFIVGRFVIVVTLLPRYFDGEMLTAYEMLGRRYGSTVQKATSLLFLVTRNLGDGLRLFLAALALRAVLPVSFATCVLLVGSVTVAYTLVGGMKSVVWNDCVQFVIYIAGAIVALFLLAEQLPEGWQTIAEYGIAYDKFHWLDLSWNLDRPYTLAAGLVGGAFLSLGTHGTDQMIVQRLLGAGSLRHAGKALLTSGVVVFLQFALFLFVGVALACFYRYHPPATAFASNDEVFSRFIVTELPAGWGLIGLILAAVFAAAMSTLSSSLNASASAVVGDFLQPRIGDRWNDRKYVAASRLLTVLFGVLQIVIALIAIRLSRSVVNEALAIAGFAAGVLLGVFLLALLRRRVPASAGLAGMTVGAGVLFAVHFATDIAWPWYAAIGTVVTFSTGGLLWSALLAAGQAEKQHVEKSEDGHVPAPKQDGASNSDP